MLELYNLFIYGKKAASSDCVQATSLHLAEARGLFYEKDIVSASQTVGRKVCVPSLLWCVHGRLEPRCWGDGLPVPPAPAEPSYPASWVGLRNLSSKSSNFSPCGCYSVPHGKQVKLAAKGSTCYLGQKSVSQLLYLGTCIYNLSATQEDEELMYAIMPPSVLQFPMEESW